jgi:hypothetical protein
VQERVSASIPLEDSPTDTLYLPAGTDTVGNDTNNYGSFTIGDNGSGSLVVTSTTGALVATGNTIHFDLTKLAAVTFYGNEVNPGGGSFHIRIPDVLLDGQETYPDTAYFPAGTEGIYTWGPGYLVGTFTVSDIGSGSLGVTATTGTVIATDPHTIHFSPPYFQVTNTNDSGPGSLGQAILDVDSYAGPNAVIDFNIPTTDPGYQSTTGAFIIKPTSALPTLTDAVVIDGYTQPGASPNTLTIGDNAVLKIVLDGSQAGAVDGLVIAGGNSTLRGLVIDNFGYGTGIYITGGGNDAVVGNFIGTDATGVASGANNNGLLIYSSGNTVGGTTPGDRNLISGNNSGLPDSADGGSQPGDRGIYLGNGNLLQGNYIGTDRSGTSALGNGLGIEAGSNSTIGGLTATPGTGAGNLISGNIVFGIDRAGNQNLIAGNLIGTTATGLAALGNGAGIHLWGNNNTVGGTTAGARNIISGNTGPGGAGVINAAIDIENVTGVVLAGGSYNLVEGNYIGTDISGTTSLGGQTGIIIAGAYNTIGGTTAAARNVISGNNSFGIQINNNGPFDINFGNVVQGNYIGTDPTGAQVVGNRGTGIYLLGATHDDIIGGPLPGEGNLVSGNSVGIFLNKSIAGPTNNLIQGNLIGTDKTGAIALGNGEGVEIDFGNNNTIGGIAAGAGNTIAFNRDPRLAGVNVYSGTGNSIRGNSIHDNAGLGIDLGQDGVTLNTPGGPHSGPNNLQNYPVLTAVTTTGSQTTIQGTLNSTANTSFALDFYANDQLHPSGHGEGKTYLGSITVTTDSSGNAGFTATFSAVVPEGNFVSATATDPAGNTSEFSKDLVVGCFLVTNTNDSGVGSLREAIYDANTLAYGTPANPDCIMFNIPTSDPGYNSTTGAFSIKPLSALPTLTDTAIVDGYTQPGATPNTLTIGDNAVLKIVLDGSLAGVVDGLVIAGGNSTVRGLVIDNFAYGSGIVLNGSGNDLVLGNFIGTDVTGESAAANNIGILASNGEIIGRPSPGDRNVISGNNSSLPDTADGGSQPAGLGIDLSDGSLIRGNYIGTDRSGTLALDNGGPFAHDTGAGIEVHSNNTIGGLTATPGTGAGNLISGNTAFGVVLGGNQNLVAGNLIGTTATGLAALGNGAGIYVTGNNNTIGGTTAGARNIIAGNSGPGGGGFDNLAIDIDNVGPVSLAGGSYNLVEGNYIGIDITGTTSLGGQAGIGIAGAYNTIGGTTAAARNVISGNNGTGIGISSGNPSVPSFGNVVEGNYIGTDASGTIVVRNLGFGVTLAWGTNDNTIGGTLPGAGNVISGFNGILLRGLPSIGLPCTNNLIQGNLIGTDKTGIVGLGNPGDGIDITDANNNTIGGTTAGAGNTIAFSTYDGVSVNSGTGNSILGNSIHDNTGLGILLNSATNANDNQAAPVLTSLTGTPASPLLSGSLTSAANTTFRIEFFANPLPSNVANTEGQTLLGSVYVTTNASGKATFTASGLAAIPVTANYLTATATVATLSGTSYTYGDTSQFSSYQKVSYFFGGFQAPLNKGMNFALNRGIPINFTLTDLTGAAVTSLAAVSSLQVAPVNTDGSLGTLFTPASTGNGGLTVSNAIYSFNWATKGLTAGSYAIVLTLADGTTQTKVITLAKGGNSAGLTTTAAGGTGTAPGGLLGGDIDLYVDNTNGDLTADELARIQDAVTAADAVTEPYGVAVTEVTDRTLADVTLNMDTTSAVGGYADGVLGCTTDAGQITIINGWNFYAGSDATQIGASQYDFETVVEHELGHALGLGHSTDSTSVMYATLNSGTVNRSLKTADLNVPDSDTTGACGLHAAIAPESVKPSPAPALPAASVDATINSALANALASGSAKFVSVQPAVAVEPTVNQANVSVVGTIAFVRQNVAVDQFFAQVGQNATTNDSGQPEHELPVNAPETNLLEENALPLEPVPAPESGDDYRGLLGNALAVDELGTAMWLDARDTCFADDDWSPRSETMAAGSLIAVGMAANPTLFDNLVRMRTMHGRERNHKPALAKR